MANKRTVRGSRSLFCKLRIGGRVRELEKRRRLMQEPMPADHDRSSTRALNRGNTGIGSDRKNEPSTLTSAAVARKRGGHYPREMAN